MATRIGRITVVLGLVLTLGHWSPAAEPPTAEAVYQATGVQGGLVVHLGCGDGSLTATLRPNDRYLVQGLDTDADQVAMARQTLLAQGVNGLITVNTFDGRNLPYVDSTVNLLLAADLGDVSLDEVARVLAPDGVLYLGHGDHWHKDIKRRPAEIDEWSHFLHDASGNAVAADSKIGSPTRLRWVAGPRWCRSHECPSSVNAVVTAGGRIFTIFDEGPTGIYERVPWRCRLIARDAANGVLLWKVPMRGWQPEFGTGTGDRWHIHHTIPRRLVAQGDRVYVTLGFLDSPVSVLDAATGEILTEALPGTQGADEILLADGILIVKITDGRSVAATARIGKDTPVDTLTAVDVATGKSLWRTKKTRVVPYALSAHAGRVVYHNLKELVCLDARTGDETWRVSCNIGSPLAGTNTLVINDGVVLYHGAGRATTDAAVDAPKPKAGPQLNALSLADGKILWQYGGSKSQAQACTQPTDLYVVDGIVWCGTSLAGRDLHSGEVVRKLDLEQLISPGHHYRCHRGKATQEFMIWPKRGAEFVDLDGDDHMRNDWLRAPCFTGPTPANGLLYMPPDQCFCYPGVKVSGYLAMSSEPVDKLKPTADAALTRGPAFGKIEATQEITEADWPMHRRDGQRSGATRIAVPAGLKPQWNVALAGQTTQPVIVGDRLWVAEKDTHRIRCFGTVDGKDLWSFTAAGRIDSTPTVHNGAVLFGCRDGSVYCLRASDGVMAWRFAAAPTSRQIVSFGQLESIYPISGSVFVQDDVVYFAAGRSSFLDGGILVYGLDVATGKVLYHHLLDGPRPDIKTDVGTPFAMEGALSDLIVGDGKDLYMQRIKFDAKLNRLATIEESSLGELDMGADHLVATGGFLDDTGFDRLYWMHGNRWPGFYFSQQSPKAGQLVVFDDRTTYAVKYFYRRHRWSPLFIPGSHGYLLFADAIDNQPALEEKDKSVTRLEWLPKETLTDSHRRGGRGVEKGTGYVRTAPAKWQTMIPLRIRAMLLADDLLFTAGLPDVHDPADPMAALDGLEGRRGALLQVFSTQDGSLVASRDLPAVPTFDGMSAAAGRLYLTTLDGQVLCYGK